MYGNAVDMEVKGKNKEDTKKIFLEYINVAFDDLAAAMPVSVAAVAAGAETVRALKAMKQGPTPNDVVN